MRSLIIAGQSQSRARTNGRKNPEKPHIVTKVSCAKNKRKAWSVVLCALLVVVRVACSTVRWPDRRRRAQRKWRPGARGYYGGRRRRNKGAHGDVQRESSDEAEL
jgi:uncharacterized membrane protein YgcG